MTASFKCCSLAELGLRVNEAWALLAILFPHAGIAPGCGERIRGLSPTASTTAPAASTRSSRPTSPPARWIGPVCITHSTCGPTRSSKTDGPSLRAKCRELPPGARSHPQRRDRPVRSFQYWGHGRTPRGTAPLGTPRSVAFIDCSTAPPCGRSCRVTTFAARGRRVGRYVVDD